MRVIFAALSFILLFSGISHASSDAKYLSIGTFPHWEKVVSSYKKSDNNSNMNLEQVNRSVNKVRYVSDSRNWGKGDYWASPEDFYKRGGDCEDYAIAKYFKLMDMGYSPDNMEIMVLFKRRTQEYHAVLKVKDGRKTYIMDNEYNKLMDTAYLKNYDIMYYLSDKGWRV